MLCCITSANGCCIVPRQSIHLAHAHAEAALDFERSRAAQRLRSYCVDVVFISVFQVAPTPDQQPGKSDMNKCFRSGIKSRPRNVAVFVWRRCRRFSASEPSATRYRERVRECEEGLEANTTTCHNSIDKL